MVEHTTAQTTQNQHQQSFDRVESQCWRRQQQQRHRSQGSPELVNSANNAGSSTGHRFSLFRWFRRRDSSSSTDNRRRHLFRKKKRRASVSSTSSSVDTLYSTATVKSFAFHSGARRGAGDVALKLEQHAVGPFAPGAVKLVERARYRADGSQRLDDAPTTCTLPTAFLQRQHIQTRYALHPLNGPFVSYDSIPIVETRPRTFAEAPRYNVIHDQTIESVTSDSSLSGARRLHVKGKRRAPDPPGQQIIRIHVAGASADTRPTGRGRRKRRPAPKPPGYGETLSSNQDTLSSEASIVMDSFLIGKDNQTISNDTLVLRRGILLSKRDINLASRSESRTPTTSTCDSDGGDTIVSDKTSVSGVDKKAGSIMPRPWYKRNASHDQSSGSRDTPTNSRKGGGDFLRGLSTPATPEVKDENVSSTSSTLSSSFPFEGSLSRLGFFHRNDRNHHDDKKKDNKRKSGVSILTNISELDKEAAAIVQEEQARNRASMILQAAKLDQDFERRMKANEAIVQEIVNSSLENSPRKSTRALISKFNALGNLKVNSNFFSRSNNSSPKARAKRFSQECNNSRLDDFADDKDKDLSKYFLPHQPSPKRESASVFTEIVNPGKSKVAVTESNTTNPKVDSTVTIASSNSAPKITVTNVADTLITSPNAISASISRVTPRISVTSTAAVTGTENIESARMTNAATVVNSVIATTNTTPTATTNSVIVTAKPAITPNKTIVNKGEVNEAEFAKSLAAELDDVATGIARLRHELNTRPKLIDKALSDHEKTKVSKKETPMTVSKLNPTRGRELTNFDTEFTKIFDEIDRQLRTKESQLAATKPKMNSASKETSISNQVARVLDILANVEKTANVTKNVAKVPRETRTIIFLEDPKNKPPMMKEALTTTARISGVDDKTTAELKVMLKEMKHSLPKRPKPKSTSRTEKKSENSKPSEEVLNKPSTSAYRPTIQPVAPPRISTKVSSGVQTSGNLRKIMNDTVANPRSNENDIVARVTEKKPYEPIKQNEFTKIGPAKSKTCPENTYVNVIEGSLYANAQVASPSMGKVAAKGEKGLTSWVKIDSRERDSKQTASPVEAWLQTTGNQAAEEDDSNNEEGEKLEEAKKQYMNTLAVNRLLRKLEAAIASGNHQQASGLARELAQLKIHCSVVRQRPSNPKQKLSLNLYIEDKQAHQGPIPLQLPVTMSVAQLKAKIHIEFEIPANVQRWIIGKNLADNDESTLEELQAVEGSSIFLYLVAPLATQEIDDLQDKGAIKLDKQEKKDEGKERVRVEQVMNGSNDEQIREIKVEIEPEPEPEAQAEPAAEAKAEPQTRQDKERSLSRQEKLKRYEELMSLENCDVILTTEPIECPVCFMITVPGEGVILRDCLHSFCRSCVASVVRYCEEAEVRCPYRDADYTCESTLQEREIKALVSAEVYQQHLAKSMAQAENSAGNNAFHCKTPDCPGWCIYDDDVNNFLCPVCRANNCLTCQVIHMGKNCRQYQEELKYSKETDHESKRTAAMLEEMVDRGEALPCPTCAVVLMKKWGCDWLRCSMCKTEICWVTRGPRWGPGGKGDTSGGCKCGENGVKCHPRCNYCH